MNPRFTIAIIVGAFLLGLGMVSGFALGRRTAFFASQFPSKADEPVESSVRLEGFKSGAVTAVDSESVKIVLDDGKAMVIARSSIIAVESVRPLAPDEFARALASYRAALKRGDQKASPPSDSAIASLGVSDIKEGMRVNVEGSGDKQKILIRQK